MWVLALLLIVAALGVLALLAVGAAVMFAAFHAMPWLLILVGIWLLLRATRGTGRSRRMGAAAGYQTRRAHWHGRRPAGQESPWTYPGAPRPDVMGDKGRREDVQPDAPAGAPSPPPRPEQRPQARPRRDLPSDVQVKVEQIRHKADMLLGYADRFPPFSHDLHLVRQTTADYLPRTIEAYLALPGGDDPVIPATGKTALEELRGQLGLLDHKLDEITQNLQRGDLDRLLANRRFLEERFEQPEPEITAEGARQQSDAA